MRVKKCLMCASAYPMPDDPFCGACSEGIENLWAAGWSVTPPKIKEQRTARASTYRRYSKPSTPENTP